MKYTLDEAKIEIARRECERAGHLPNIPPDQESARLFGRNKTYDDALLCRCGTYRWTADPA